jgi:hypothetical protein
MIALKKGPTTGGDAGGDGKWAGGIALIAIGGLLLLTQLTNATWTGLLIFPALALIFLTWGIAQRNAGPMIPAGIFIGLSLGTWLVTGEWFTSGLADINSEDEAGVFLLAFAVGWASITLLSALFTRQIHWWPLIPGGFMAVIGGAILVGGSDLQALVWLGYAWPLAMIALGILLLLRVAGGRRESTGSTGSTGSSDTPQR